MAKVTRLRLKNFTQVSNILIDNRELSLRAKGLFLVLYRLPDDWDFHFSDIVKRSKEGEGATRTALRELEKGHYVKRTRMHDSHGYMMNYAWNLDDEGRVDELLAAPPKCKNRQEGENADKSTISPKCKNRKGGQNADKSTISPSLQESHHGELSTTNTYIHQYLYIKLIHLCSSSAHVNENYPENLFTFSKIEDCKVLNLQTDVVTNSDKINKSDVDPAAKGSNVDLLNTQTNVVTDSMHADSQIELQKIFDLWTDIWGFPNKFCIEAFTNWQHEFGTDVVLHMLTYAGKQGAVNPLGFLKTVVKQYRTDNVQNVKQAKNSEQQFLRKRRRKHPNQQGFGDSSEPPKPSGIKIPIFKLNF